MLEEEEPVQEIEKKSLFSEGKDYIDVEKLLKNMVERGASDLHLSSEEYPVMRIDGDINILNEYEKIESELLMKGLTYVTPERNIEEFKERNDTDFGFEINGLARFRGNIFRDHRGIGAVFRQIPSNIIPAEKLNIPKAVIDLLKNPKGLILVTGPTGSGKSTTLAAMVDYINKNYKKHIITIEDPVEFVHPNKKSLVNQREINTHTESFTSALRAALREDPDVVLVGEMRDLETTAIAIEMAATGHLVMGTLHTNTAIGTVDRLIDQFPTTQQEQIKMMLSDALIGVVSQMLCKKIGGGRVAAYEILVVNTAVSNLIREGKNFQIASIMETGTKYGNCLMNRSFRELVKSNLVSVDEALSKSADSRELEKNLIDEGLIRSRNNYENISEF
ncbi:MAG: type IV pili twitching motility protein PilT [Candidatus Cloacimonadota bacterium]|nr:MAG: type IV pili twitching motility protein PilT [Candidatus Cloacimonadota bacterium]PIE77354.1 MAG: type IV pili twitching motility protein PilT [Candidatus Delongbacteria bacterium]